MLTLWNNEEGADEVERLLHADVVIQVSFMTLMEARYRIWKNVSREASDEFARYLDWLQVERVGVTPDILQEAVELKATHSLSVCDSWIIATAIALDATLVHKDPEFEQVAGTAKLIALPYKVRRSEEAKK